MFRDTHRLPSRAERVTSQPNRCTSWIWLSALLNNASHRQQCILGMSSLSLPPPPLGLLMSLLSGALHACRFAFPPLDDCRLCITACGLGIMLMVYSPAVRTCQSEQIPAHQVFSCAVFLRGKELINSFFFLNSLYTTALLNFQF